MCRLYKPKWITQTIEVELNRSRCVWDNGIQGDDRVELWTGTGYAGGEGPPIGVKRIRGDFVWLETNGDPVTASDEIHYHLLAGNVSPGTAAQWCLGNFKGEPCPQN